jgi:hypothetical protein
MDNRLNDALAFANYRLTLQIQRKNIEQRVTAALVLNYSGYVFNVSKELINFVSAHLQFNRESQLIIDDQKENAVVIDNPDEFIERMFACYNQAMQLKRAEQEKLKSARNPGKLVGL